MEQVQVKGTSRVVSTKGKLRQLRASGHVPAVIYGREKEPLPIAVDTKDLTAVMQLPTGINTIINLQIEGNEDTVIIKDLNRDIFLPERFSHVDFLRISLKDKLEVQIPVHLIGEPEGVITDGGIMQHLLREIVIKCLPTNIPKQLELDISKLGIGQSLTVADIPCPEDAEVISDLSEVVISIISPKVVEEAEETTEEETEITTEDVKEKEEEV